MHFWGLKHKEVVTQKGYSEGDFLASASGLAATPRKSQSAQCDHDSEIQYVPVKATDRVDMSAWQMADKDVELELNLCACLQQWCPWDHPTQELVNTYS